MTSQDWVPPIGLCLGYTFALSAGLLAAGTAVIWWAANHPGGIADRAVTLLLPHWMGEDR